MMLIAVAQTFFDSLRLAGRLRILERFVGSGRRLIVKRSDASIAVFVVMLLAILAGTKSVAAGEEGDTESFCGFLSKFVSVWDTRDLRRLDNLLLPELGIWVIYNVGTNPIPYRFSSISEALGEGEHGFGYLGAVGFHDCGPKPGPPPHCEAEGDLQPLCRFGESKPVFLEVFDSYLRHGIGDPELQARVRKDREFLRSIAGESVRFVSDNNWGAIFYFVKTDDDWKLLVVDISDCSA